MNPTKSTSHKELPTLDTPQVQALLDRYMAGQTTVEEERQLAAWFRCHQVPECWLPYQKMFAWLDDGMPRTEGILEEDGAAAQRRTASDGRRHTARTVGLRPWWIGAASAAAVAALLWMVWPRQADVSNTPSQWTAQVDGSEERHPVTPQQADTTVQTQPATVDSNLERNTVQMREYRRFHRTIVSPDRFLAERETTSRQTDFNRQTQLQADSIIQAVQREIDGQLLVHRLYALALGNRIDSLISQQQTAYENVLTEDEEASTDRIH